MRIRMTLGLALVAAALWGCCPGSMLGNGVPGPDTHPQVAAAQPVDTDGDGVPDASDRCPGTPRGVAVDANGCPLDTDGDGVPDHLDKCPDTPRGEPVNRDGCSAAQLAAMAPPPAPAPPPSHAEQELTARGEIRIENVYFETNSSKLTPESAAPLDEAGAALAKYPALKVEVGGHTDARGSAAYNLRLSQDRAEAVRQYLLDHHRLNADQVTAKGYGEADASKTARTPEELQKDRCVVLRVLNPEALPKNVEIKQ